MTRHSHLVGLLVFAGMGLSREAAAAPSYKDGTAVENSAWCWLSNSWGTGIVSRAGYKVDPVAELPQLGFGGVTYIHAVATNKDRCGAGDTVGFEFFLPPGASFAISSAIP